jgi:hypothetical protein
MTRCEANSNGSLCPKHATHIAHLPCPRGEATEVCCVCEHHARLAQILGVVTQRLHGQPVAGGAR